MFYIAGRSYAAWERVGEGTCIFRLEYRFIRSGVKCWEVRGARGREEAGRDGGRGGGNKDDHGSMMILPFNSMLYVLLLAVLSARMTDVTAATAAAAFGGIDC